MLITFFKEKNDKILSWIHEVEGKALVDKKNRRHSYYFIC